MTTNHDAARRGAFEALLATVAPAFTRPGFEIFATLVSGWVLAAGRRTLTAMIAVADPTGVRAHDAYHRFMRVGSWSMEALWRALAVRMVTLFHPEGTVPLDLDDTLHKKSGRKVEGAGIFRDAVRSTRSKVVYATGLNLVVLTLRVNPPWGGCPIGLPVNVRLHKKNGPTTVDLAEEMVRQVVGWFPERLFALCADGAYATLAGRGLERCSVTSRMRRDAALYEPPPARTGRRGRPRTKGARIGTPVELAATVGARAWKKVTVDCRGKKLAVLVWSRQVLWYGVDKTHLVLLVVVRDPSGTMHDDFFFTTDLEADAGWVASHYMGRWSIEVCFRDEKQILHSEDPQSWKYKGPENAACLSLWLHAAIWCWYIETYGTATTWLSRPWYRRKSVPSFLDAVAALRRVLWCARITEVSSSEDDLAEILDTLIETVATAA